jgi:hypothetical protein
MRASAGPIGHPWCFTPPPVRRTPAGIAVRAEGREVTNLLVGRMYRWQGLQPSDVIQSVYGHGMINGGHYIREAVTHFTNSLLSSPPGQELRLDRSIRCS